MNAMLIAINCLVFMFAAVIWNRENIFNMAIKGMLWVLCICNAIAMMNACGFVVRLHP